MSTVYIANFWQPLDARFPQTILKLLRLHFETNILLIHYEICNQTHSLGAFLNEEKRLAYRR